MASFKNFHTRGDSCRNWQLFSSRDRILWCQTDLDTHYQTVAVMVSYNSILCDLYDENLWEFFGEPNGSPHEVSGGFISSCKTHGFALGF